ncbi:MAG: 4-hydroxy-tetrahydrodipicolinate synthase [Clostridium sp.]|uniref:4-hydroxy-tetrahydrodipicolinate synthase n=1 Tax=Clostridium culturomicium TaxID=1499683 RepID=UPI00058B9157|nr:4-hydroxy-tetrahydrodipicolinate synthase [Clostridium culturomicium]MDU4892058.1 4-hydroxy-tetrahydrodipicolinate synthase [Clostridium sp.]MDU7082445.1 4-hydroxy-tetrahydrodipicolinate synthase [Clostridium sp.]
MSIFKGSGVAIVTPFNEAGVDFSKLKELLEWHIENKTDAIIICGTTGEASTMTENEKKETIKFTVDTVNKRIPVIAGTGSNNTMASVEMSKYAESVGVDGLLIINPYYNKTSAKGLIAHFKKIAEAVTTPIVVYNVPSRTGMNITPNALLELSKLENIVAVKEASGNISQIAEIKYLCGDNLDIYSGNDNEILPTLAIGGLGVISVIANIVPKDVHNICELFFNGEIKASQDLFLKTIPLTNACFCETNPIPIKTAMNLLGHNVGSLRLPLVDMADNTLELLKNSLKDYGLL